MNPDFIFSAADQIAAWLADVDEIKFAASAFRTEGAEPQKRMPAVLVYPLSEDPNPNVGSRTEPVQVVSAHIGVLHIVSAPNRPAGRGRGHDRMMSAVRLSRQTILRHRSKVDMISGARTSPAFSGGALEEITDGRIYWLDRYSIDWVLDAQKFRL